MANLITGSRFIFSLIMLCFPTGSVSVYCCYLLAGLTDVLDGIAARRFGSTSKFGAKLDTAADFVFVLAAAYKLLPMLNISLSIWIWTGVIALIKVINVFFGYVMYKQFVSVHTAANKVTGLLLFLLPLSARLIDFRYSAGVVCIIATFAAIQEGHFIRTGKRA